MFGKSHEQPEVRGGRRGSDKELVDYYYSRMDEPDKLKRDGHFREALSVAMELVDLIPTLVRYTKHEYGKFDLRSIPPLESACVIASVRQDRAALKRLRSLVDTDPDLSGWKVNVEQCDQDLALVEDIRSFLTESPGSLQSSIGKQLGADGRNTSRLIKYMADDRQLRREPEGKTYRVFLA